MPDTAPGATPVLFGNLQAAYLLVYRKQTTMLQDPYSMGYCILFRFGSRVGGTVICANAARLLRIK
jgi:HK97 family phage major capsid protein